MRLVDRTPSETSLISIGDCPFGLLIYDFDERDLFQRGLAAIRREELRQKCFSSPSTVVNGSCEIGSQSTRMSFDPYSHPDPIQLLKKLLCRAFGYEQLHLEAERLFSRDPLVNYDGISLGKLHRIIEDARAIHVSKIALASPGLV